MDMLELVLKNAANDPSSRPEFYRVLLESKLFVITPNVKEQNKETVINKGTMIEILNFKDKNGVEYIPIFSSLDNLKKSITEETGYMAMDSINLLEIICKSRAILNPSSDFSKELLSTEMKQIIDGSIFSKSSDSYVVEKETTVIIGHPKVYPTKLVKNLSSLFKKYKSVKRAYLAHFFNPDKDTKAHSLIVIDAPNAPEQLFSDAGLTAQASLEYGDYVDFMRYENDELTKSIERDFKPFYTRKLLGIIKY